MSKLVRIVKRTAYNPMRLLALAISIMLTAFAQRSQAQVYYTYNDANGSTETDAIKKVNYDGSSITQIMTNFTPSPTLMSLDLPNSRAFVYEAFSSSTSLPNSLAIKVVNLSNGTVTTSIPLAVAGRLQAIDYDAVNNYIYYVVQDAAPTSASSGDVLVKVKPDGTGSTTVASGFCDNPELMKLDIPNNRAFVYENLFADHSIYTINLSNGSATHFATTAGTGSLFGIQMDYDPTTDYIYLVTSDGNTSPGITTTAANDAVYKVHPDGTGYTAIKSSMFTNPYSAAFDFGHNLAYVFDSASKNIYSVSLSDGTLSTFLSATTLGLSGSQVIGGIAAPQRPILTTATPSSISSTSVTVGGNITRSDALVTDRGVVYSSSNSTPTTSDSKFAIGTGTGSFSSSLTGLNAVTTYYVRAYAISAAGTSYGSVSSFTTVSNDASMSAISLSSASLSPGFTAANTTYTASVAYATTATTVTPTHEQANATIQVNGTAVTSGTASGSINLAVGDNTISVKGTAQDNTTTKTYNITVTRAAPQLPVVSTSTPASITGTSAILGGSVTQSDAPVTDRGVVYSTTNTTPTTSDTKAANGTGTGSYSATISGLTPGITYYVRAYAISVAGTNYGAVSSFNTLSNDASMASIALGSGTLSPTFSSTTTSYTATVPNSTSSVTVTATHNQASTTITVNGAAATSGTATSAISLVQGTNTINVTGTAPDGSTTKTYTITVIRQFVPPGNALVFDGSNDGVIMGTPSTAITGRFTVEAWVKPNDGTKDMHVFSTRNGSVTSFDVQITGGNTIHGDIGSGSGWLNTAINASFNYKAGQWMHIAYVIVPGTYTIYVNGNQVGGGTIPAGTPLLYNSTNNITIGYDPGENSFLNGAVDEVRVYNTALTQANIQADMVSTTSAVPASLVNYYNFDNGTPGGTNTGITTLIDSKSGYNGTVASFALTGTTSNWVASDAMVIPVAIAATQDTVTSFTANWTAPTIGTVTGYQLEVSKTADFGSPVTGSPFSSTATSLNITGLTANTPYYYRVEAITDATAGLGAPSNIITVTTQPSHDATLVSANLTNATSTGSLGGANTIVRAFVPAGNANFTVTPQLTNSFATVMVNGVGVPNNTASQQLSFSYTDTTYVKIKVTAQDGVTTKTYTYYFVPVYDLKSLALNAGTLNPSFAQSTFSYTATETTDALQLTPVTFSGSAVSINGVSKPSGTTVSVPLQIGSNTIAINAPGSDNLGAAYPYTLTVTRLSADLSSLIIDQGTLTPTFGAATISYAAEVTDDITSIGITATAADNTAVITYAGTPEPSGTPFYVPLQEGDNSIPIMVTSADGSINKTYTLTIHKDISADLLRLTSSSGVLNPRTIQDPANNTFTASVANTVSSVTLTPTLVSSIATMTVNSQAVTSGTPSQSIPLSEGDNTITITVTSPDTVRSYTVTINRAAAPPAIASGSSANMTEVYTATVPIAPLTSPFSGIAAPGGYSQWPKVVNSTSFDTPTGIATDAAGNIYVANYTTGTVSKMPKGGGTPVVVDSLSQVPYGIAVDSAGNNLYIADLGGFVLRQIALTPQGQTATFNSTAPTGVAVDHSGNIFVLNNFSTLSEIKNDAGRTVTDLNTTFSNPYGVAVDSANNLYVADAADPDGKIIKIPASGPGTYGTPVKIGSGFNSASGVAADTKGNVFVLDLNTVKEIAAGGNTVSTLTDKLGGPFGIALDKFSNIYISDNSNSVIDVLQPAGGYTITPALPAGLTLDATSGTISGTPTKASPATDYTLTGYNTGGEAMADLNITINSAPTTINAIAAVDTLLTNKDTVSYKVTFASAITGLSASNFTLSGTAATAGINSVTGSGTTWNVKLNTGTTDGTLTLSLANATGLSTTLTNTLPFAGNTYTVDKTPPQISPLYDLSNNPNYAVAVVGNVITLHFGSNEPVRTPVVTIAGHSVTADSVGVNNYIATYTMTSGDTPGRVHFTVSITDLAGNNSFNNDIASGADIEFSLSAALVSLNLKTPGVTNAATATWHAIFSGSVTGLTTSAFTITPTGTATGTVASVTATSASEYDITANAISGDGTLTLNLADATAISPNLTNTLPFTGQADTTDHILPSISIGNPSVSGTVSGPVTYTVYYGDANFSAVTLSPADVTLNKTGTANGSVSVSGTGEVSTITISNITGTGTLGISLATGTAVDKAGNLAPAAGPAPTFVVQSTDATLANLTLGSGISLDQSFSPATTSYTASVSNAISSIDVTAMTSNPNATLTINNGAATSNQAKNISLHVGMNSIPIIVTAQDGVTTGTYGLIITRAGSSVTTVNNITISSGTLKPAFNQNTTGYTASVPNATSSVILTPTLGDAGETIVVKVNGNTVSTTADPATIPLAPGANTITTVITAGNGTSMGTYTIVIARAHSTDNNLSSLVFSGSTLSPVFNPATLTYTATTAISAVTLTATAEDPEATLNINGRIPASGSPVPFTLTAASSNITVAVKAGNGAVKNYKLNIIKTTSSDVAATLVLNPRSWLNVVSSTAAAIGYATSVDPSVSSVSITTTAHDPSATITVNGTPVASGAPSAPVQLNGDGTPTVVTTVVTAQDGTHKSYVVTISKNGSSDLTASLKLTPSATLTSVSNGGLTNQSNYTTSVNAATPSVTLTVTADDPQAGIKINSITTASGTPSAPITLNTDGTPTLVTALITARDGEQKTHVISISKNGSNDVTATLRLSPVARLTTVSTSATQAGYTTSVSAATTSVTLTAITEDPAATVKINGTTAVSGTPSAPITLNTDGTSTLVTAVVTAQDGEQKSYVISISKNGSSDLVATLKLTPSAKLTAVSTTVRNENDYTTSVAGTVTSVMLTVTADDTTSAAITVNGITTASGVASAPITLNTDGTPTIVTAVVTSGDGEQNSYVVSISKSSAGGASLAAIPLQVPQQETVINEVTVHQAVTPDGDGINEVLKIDNIAAYPDNRLVVINKGGAKVYEAAGYDNNSKAFDGHSSLNRAMLPPGTYYYMLDYKKDGAARHKTGYFVLKY